MASITPKGILIAVLAGLALWGSTKLKPSPPPLENHASTALASSEGVMRCKRAWLDLEQKGLLKGERVVADRAEIRVNEPLFRALDYDTKAGLATIFNCIFSPSGNQFARMDFISDLTNQPVAQWRFGRLTVL